MLMNIDFLNDGAPECPMIRIYGSDTRQFLELFDSISELARGTNDDACLDDLDGFTSEGRCVVTLSTTEDVDSVGVFGSNERLVWRLTRDMWGVVAGLIKPFSTGSVGIRHQWLMGREARYGLEASNISVLLTNSENGHW
jgi:hypothetical protein